MCSCRYSNPYVLGDWIGWTNQQAKRLQATITRTNTDEENKVRRLKKERRGGGEAGWRKDFRTGGLMD
jgi:hypothetical protein